MREVFVIEGVVVMTGQSRMVDLRYLGVVSQEINDL